MRQTLCRLMLCTGIAVLCCLTANAQEKKWVSGSVKDPAGNPVAAATVAEKGTSNQTASDNQGNFSIQVGPAATLVISAIGFATFEAPANGPLNFNLQTAASGLDEVVVTALGIRRQKKSLGFSVQEVKGRALVEAREPNITNSLSGLVAGLQVIRSGNGPGGSSKITLRGNNSLSSISGSNQPLIVVDGIPIDNFTGVDNNDAWNPGMDRGNGLSDINPEDIESISVLKGAASAALYGSRAGNGAILITTKSGRKQNGLGIGFSSTLGIEKIFTTPERQSSFAQGGSGAYNPTSASSWGPKITGQEVTNWENKKVNLRAFDHVKDFYGTGISNTQNLSFQQQVNKVNIYSSLSYFNDKSMIPNVKLTRTNFMLRANSKFGKEDRWSTDVKVQYSNSIAKNRPQAGSNYDNYSANFYQLPVTVDMHDLKNAVNPDRTMRWYINDNSVNPYWISEYRQNIDNRDRYMINGSVKYEFTDWLNAELKAGGDIYTTFFETKQYSGSIQSMGKNGRYMNGTIRAREFNYSTLITARKDDLFGKLGGSATVGGNLMDRKWHHVQADAGELQVPNFFHILNSKGNTTLTDKLKDKKINSVYGTVGVNWDGYLYLEGTFRNDWTSTLHPDNRSYFYPSVSLSYIFTETFKSLPSWFNYGKVRASVSTVGNDMDPYQLYNTYVIERDPNNRVLAKRNITLFDSTVINELINSTEIGAELRFLNNRIGLDIAYYKTTAKQQLIDLPMDPGSGYEKKKINAGRIENKGIEISLDARILNNANGLNWNLNANFAANRNRILEIYPQEGVSKYLLQGYDDVAIMAEAGKLYGEIYGTTFLRVSDKGSADYGKLLLSDNGLPQRNEERVRLGNQQPKSIIGVTNSFTYKNFSFSFLFDARIGGEVFSATNALLQRSGAAAVTVVNGEREDFVVDGVVPKSGGGYEKNSVAVSPQRYWEAVAGVGNLGITEANVYDATSVRIRNIQLGYELPRGFLSKTPIQRARIGLSCNNVWLITGHLRGQDPEAVFATGNNAYGFETFAPPTTRTFLFNLSLSF